MKIKSWSIGALSIILIGGGYWYFFMRTTSVIIENQIIRVVTGSLSTSIKSTGKISPIQTTTLSFSKQGTISKIYKKVGDEVKVGDIIAEIDAKSAYMDIESAKLALSNAKNNYNKLFLSTTESDKIRAKSTLEESKANLDLLESQYKNLVIIDKNTLAENESNIKLLADKLALATSELDYTKKNVSTDTTSNNLEKDLSNAKILLEDINALFPEMLKNIQTVLYIGNESFYGYGDFSGKDPSIKMNAISLFKSASGSYEGISGDLEKFRTNTTPSFDDTLKLLQKMQVFLSDLVKVTGLGVDAYEASYESSDLSYSLIATQKTSLRSYSSQISAKLSSLNSTITALKGYGNTDLQVLSDKNTISAKEQALTSAKNEHNKALSGLEELKQSQSTEQTAKQQDIEKQRNTIALNQASYDELINGPTSSDKISAENSISSANISLEKAYLTLKDYQIVATFDGVINDIPWIVGDTTLATEGVLIENKDTYEIALSLDQIDIVKVQKGMNAKIVLDAFPTESYTGIVDRVSAVPTETSGVVSYEAIVLLSIPRNDIYTKMSTTVEIIITEKNDILVIPTSAIVTENGKSYVEKSVNPTSIPRGNTGRTSGSSENSQRMSYGSGMIGSGTQFSRSGSGEGTFSGMRTNVRGSEFSGSRNSGNNNTITTTANVDTIKTEISIGMSNNGKTEVTSGLNFDDIIVIKKTSTKSGTTSSTTSSTSGSSTRRNTSGFGGPPPGF